MEGKTAIITGAAQGIGLCMARHFSERAMNVIVTDIDRQAIREASRDMPAIRFICADNADESAILKCVKYVLKEFGGIDFLVNNAGVGINKPLRELKLKEWERVMAVNATGTMLWVKHCAPYLQVSKGAVVNMASTRAMMSEKNTEAYSASKGAILSLTHALSVSLGPDIRANSISPGWIEVSDWKKKKDSKQPAHSEADKKQHPAGRVGVPQDIAELAYFLLSDKSGFITGQNFTVDGGMTVKMIYE